MSDPFKAYDIRGIFPDQLDADLAYHIGHATAIHLGLAGKRFAVGRDMRLSSPYLKSAFVKALVEAGVQVVDVGLVSTPTLSFAMHELHTDGGAQITASHNPAEYGGIKLTGPGFAPVGAGSGMEEIEKLARAKKTSTTAGGRIEDALVLDAYTTMMARFLALKRPLRVVVDGGNGMIGTLFQHLAHKLPGLTIIGQFLDPDGRFPNHDANPLKAENIRLLRERVVAEKADFGAAFDGDGDRCALVDEAGGIIACDTTTLLLAKHYLAKEKGVIAYDLRSSKAVPEIIRELGGTPVETRVGHSFIKKTMKEEHAILAGELSGHYYFRDFWGADSGLLAFILLANVASTGGRLSELVKPMVRYHHSGEVNFKVADPLAVLGRIRALGGEVSELDGVTVRHSNWWCNLRASNTEPVVRLNLEADTPALLAERLAHLKQLIAG
jgi:phosphomannomutase